MDTLKKFFPFSFTKKDDLAALIINIVIHVLVGAVIGILIGVLAKIPIVNLVCGIAGIVVEIYVISGIVLSVFDYLKILK